MPAVSTESGFDSHLVVHHRIVSSEDRVYTCTTRYAMSGTPVPGLSNINLIATQLSLGFATFFAACLTTANYYAGAQCVYYGGGNEYEGFPDMPIAFGTVDGETLPEEDCVVIRKRTGLAGRTHRGRMFVPLVPEDFQEMGRLTEDGIAAYNALAYKFKNQWAFNSTLTGLVGTPKHAAWKNGTLDTILETGVVVDVLNRRDRRNPKFLIYQQSAA